jgi:hypothetical protein
MGRNDLAGSQGDAISAVLTAVGYHFGLLLRWPALLCALIRVLLTAAPGRLSQPQHA